MGRSRDNSTTAIRPPASAGGASPGYTLIELLVTLSVMALIATVIFPYFNTGDSARLTAAADILSAELDYARSLAVTNNSKYRVVFSPAVSQFYLAHSGTNTALNTLPPSPFDLATDTAARHTTDMTKLPTGGVKLYGVMRTGTTPVRTAVAEFNPLGNTTAGENTVIWLKCGEGAAARFISVTINAVTGLTDIGDFTTVAPTLPSS